MKETKEVRKKLVTFLVTEREMERIRARQKQSGIQSLSAYLRKMAIDGYVFNLRLPDELPEMTSLLRRVSNNLNQLTRRFHGTGTIYEQDLMEIQEQIDHLWDGMKSILQKLQSLS